jgi:hypothetical protein
MRGFGIALWGAGGRLSLFHPMRALASFSLLLFSITLS